MLVSKNYTPGLHHTQETAKPLAQNAQPAQARLPDRVQLLQPCCICCTRLTALRHGGGAAALPHEHGCSPCSTRAPQPRSSPRRTRQLWRPARPAGTHAWGWENHQERSAPWEATQTCSSLSSSDSRQILDDSESGVRQNASVPAKGQSSVSLLP